MTLPDPALKTALQYQLQQLGVRRLLVLSGEAGWCAEQAAAFSEGLCGDWLWVSDRPPLGAESVTFSAVPALLGQEKQHGIFDARFGLNAEALAAFAGTLRAGSWLILLVPQWQQWPLQPDADSVRWSERPEPIPTPNFIRRLQQCLEQDPSGLIWRQHLPCTLTYLPAAPDWTPPDGQPTRQQQQILSRLLAAKEGVWILTAARGRGKSTLAGMLVAKWPGTCWVSAPAKAAAQQLCDQGQGKARFWSPDALLEYCENNAVTEVDWLLIDEAAAIPAPLLSKLIAFFPRVLLTTTVQGYEGTGRGFILKFCASLPQWHDLRLEVPIRWSATDPLEPFLDHLLLFNDAPALALQSEDIQFCTIDNAQWLSEPNLLAGFYGLLTSAHYRTSPLDLRRLLDVPGSAFAAAMLQNRVAGAIWLVDEGGLSEALAHEVWAGRRRPRGNLVAQSLAAHAGQGCAPVLRSRRVSRIAVQPDMRRQGIALALLAQQVGPAVSQGLDFLSVSFGYTSELAALWQRAGYRLVRIGSQREASSGCYAAMAVLPLSDAGHAMADDAVQQLARDVYWLQRIIPLDLDLNASDDATLTDDDWRELAGFAFAHRALESSYAALQRLLLCTELPMTALRAHLQEGLTVAQCTSNLQLSGRKALLRHWREETALALETRNAALCHHWWQFTLPRLTSLQ
ncbi:MAG: tRNA(Met) cytidine acetyltransferase TmcA [Ewingella sp.]